MSAASGSPGLSPSRRAETGSALVLVGSVLLLISLFLNWYRPGRSAWQVFEVWDLVLAALAVMAIIAASGRLGIIRPRPDSWLIGPAVGAFVIVVASLLNHPPAAAHAAPMVGCWLALAASIVMLAGVASAIARVSIAIKLEDRPPPGPSSSSSPSPARASRRMFSRRTQTSDGIPSADEADGSVPTQVMSEEDPSGLHLDR